MASKPDDSLGPLIRLAWCPCWLSRLSGLMSTADVSSCGMVHTAAFHHHPCSCLHLTGSVHTLVTLDD